MTAQKPTTLVLESAHITSRFFRLADANSCLNGVHNPLPIPSARFRFVTSSVSWVGGDL